MKWFDQFCHHPALKALYNHCIIVHIPFEDICTLFLKAALSKVWHGRCCPCLESWHTSYFQVLGINSLRTECPHFILWKDHSEVVVRFYCMVEWVMEFISLQCVCLFFSLVVQVLGDAKSGSLRLEFCGFLQILMTAAKRCFCLSSDCDALRLCYSAFNPLLQLYLCGMLS